ncbi:hypothetical protein [Desulfobulbus alkaliphilus]|uniref:hypothetical protein n=1 Tax=Desulfobulbus alkaliphilus TaxID=869814 RepID=UPI00196377D3|nr:hypothetical protein [Desulfobulbus alkaliphilus]MBM9535483.1 hypothetical protein [Desulfobulbus alkaliphilus]
MTSRKPPQGQGVNCMQCRSFFITYDPRRPWGCRAYGFKSRHRPSSVVLSSSGEPCRLYVRRS